MSGFSADASSRAFRRRSLGFVYNLTPRKQRSKTGSIYKLAPRKREIVPEIRSWAAAPYWRLDRALYAFLIATLLWPYTMGWQSGTLQWGPSRIAFVVLAITFVAFWAKGEVRPRSTPLDIAVLFFMGALLASFAINSNHLTGGQLQISLKAVANIAIEWFLLFYIVASIPRDVNQVRRFLTVITGLVFVVAVVGVIEYFAGFRLYELLRQYIPGGANMRSNLHEQGLQLGLNSLVRGEITRIVSTTVSFQELGTLMAMTVPLLLYLVAYARTNRQMVACIVGLVFTTSALLLSVTRGAMLAAVVAVIFQSVFSRKAILRAGILIAAGTAVLAFLFSPKLLDAIASVAAPDVLPQEGTIQGRLQDWPVAGRLIKENELFGVGVGQVMGRQLNYGQQDVPTSFAWVDNYYLAATVEMGMAGIGTLFLIWGAIAWVLLRRQRLPQPLGSEIWDFRVSFFSSALAFMVLCFTFDALGFFTVAKFFWVIVGLGVALALIEQKMAREATGT